jgi:YD repeat-containing protein
MPDVDACVSLSAVSSPPPNNPKNMGVGCPHCGQPINPTNGNMWHRESDYITNSNPVLEITRFYNSSALDWGASDPHLFGSHWTTWMDMSVRQENSNATLNAKCWKRADTGQILCDAPPLPSATKAIPDAVSILRSDGKRFYFNRSGASYTGDADVNEQLNPVFDESNQNIIGWNLLKPDSSTESYASNGRLLQITDRTGNWIALTYSDGTTNDSSLSRWPATAPVCKNVFTGQTLQAGKLLCVTDSTGRQLNFEYSGSGFIGKVIDPMGRAIMYEYDGPSSNGCDSNNGEIRCNLGNLTKVTYQDNNSKIYYYNELSQINHGVTCSGTHAVAPGFGHLVSSMTGLVDENGDRFISWNYTCDGFADTSELNGSVEKVSFDFSPLRAGSKFAYATHVTGPAAAPTNTTQAYSFENYIGSAKNTNVNGPCYECGDLKNRYYDSSGNLTMALDWNNNYRCFAYDLSRNLETARVEGTNSSSCSNLLSATSLTLPTKKISTEWHPKFRLPTRIAEPRRITTYSYDGQGNTLSTSIQATTDITGANGFSAVTVGGVRTWTFTYDANGRVLTRKGPRSDVDGTFMYEYDASGNLVATVNPLGQRVEYSKYDAHGRVGQIQYPNGKIVNLSYGVRGWLTSSTTTADTTALKTTYEYDKAGQLVHVSNPDGTFITYTYDKAHRLIAINDNLGNSIIYTLDLTGNRIGEQVTDSNGVLARQITRVFDSLNNPVKVVGSAQ